MEACCGKNSFKQVSSLYLNPASTDGRWIGSSTACIISLNASSGVLRSAKYVHLVYGLIFLTDVLAV